jgi:membrane-bound lytic murein transglycosylase
MASTRKPRTTNLKVVKTAAEASRVAVQSESDKAAERKAARAAQLAKAREKSNETRRRQGEERRALRAAGVKSNLELYRAGEYPVAAWSDDEVSHGRPAGIGGTYEGTVGLTPKQQQEVKKELLRRGQGQFDSMYFDALQALHSVALHGENESARIKAADLLIQRVAGKTPDKVEIHSADPWQDILDKVLDDEVLERVSGE